MSEVPESPRNLRAGARIHPSVVMDGIKKAYDICYDNLWVFQKDNLEQAKDTSSLGNIAKTAGRVILAPALAALAILGYPIKEFLSPERAEEKFSQSLSDNLGLGQDEQAVIDEARSNGRRLMFNLYQTDIQKVVNHAEKTGYPPPIASDFQEINDIIQTAISDFNPRDNEKNGPKAFTNALIANIYTKLNKAYSTDYADQAERWLTHGKGETPTSPSAYLGASVNEGLLNRIANVVFVQKTLEGHPKNDKALAMNKGIIALANANRLLEMFNEALRHKDKLEEGVKEKIEKQKEMLIAQCAAFQQQLEQDSFDIDDDNDLGKAEQLSAYMDQHYDSLFELASAHASAVRMEVSLLKTGEVRCNIHFNFDTGLQTTNIKITEAEIERNVEMQMRALVARYKKQFDSDPNLQEKYKDGGFAAFLSQKEFTYTIDIPAMNNQRIKAAGLAGPEIQKKYNEFMGKFLEAGGRAMARVLHEHGVEEQTLGKNRIHLRGIATGADGKVEEAARIKEETYSETQIRDALKRSAAHDLLKEGPAAKLEAEVDAAAQSVSRQSTRSSNP